MTPVILAAAGLLLLAAAGFLTSVELGLAVVGLELLTVGLLADFGDT